MNWNSEFMEKTNKFLHSNPGILKYLHDKVEKMSPHPIYDDIESCAFSMEKKAVRIFLENGKKIAKMPLLEEEYFGGEPYRYFRVVVKMNGWKAIFSRAVEIKREDMGVQVPKRFGRVFSPNFAIAYKMAKDTEMRTIAYIYADCNLINTPENRMPPMVATTHFLCRYRVRCLKNETMPLDKVVEYLVDDDRFNPVVMNTSKIYGTCPEHTRIVRRLNKGFVFGYFDNRRLVYYLTTYISDEMMMKNQKHFSLEVFNKTFQEYSDDGMGFTLITPEGLEFIENDEITYCTDKEKIDKAIEQQQKDIEAQIRVNRRNAQKKHGTYNFSNK